MELEQPSYYAIIPAKVRYNSNLRPNEKLMYGEITCLSNKHGYCSASNAYFAKLYDVTPQAVSKWISNLERHGYIKTELIFEGKQVKYRKIFIEEVVTKDLGGINKSLIGYKQKFKDNNTSNNNTSNNKYITFDDFWNIYPRKSGKAQAQKKWEKMKVDESLFTQIKNHCTVAYLKTEKQFIPHASTYLNQERWLDEIITKHDNYNLSSIDYNEGIKKDGKF